MRILLTADPMLLVPPAGYGGIERIVDSLIGELRARGHQVALLAKAGSTCVTDVTFAWPGAKVGGKLDTLRNAFALLRAVRKFRPELIHSFSRLAYLTALLPGRTPKIMSYQRHPAPAQIHRALRLARRSTMTFTGCSDFICQQGRSGGGDWHPIHNFVDLTKIDYVPAVPTDAPLLFLSRVEAIKGPELAIAIARRSGRRLLLAGNHATSGPEGRFFAEKIAPQLDRDGVEWIGEVGDVKKNSLLGRCAALLVPIQWDEPFGIVFAEALAAGTPVITCARGAAPEIVRPGVTGFFVSDEADGAEAVGRLATLDRAACRADAVARFSVGICTDEYLRLYAQCAAKV